MSDVYAGVRNFYMTNGKPGRLADADTPPNDQGYRIAVGQMLNDDYYAFSASGPMGAGLAIIDRDELVALRDAIVAELGRQN